MPMQTSIINGIPVFEALLGSEDDGMVRISLVDSPAVLTNWQAFAEEKQPQKFAIESEDQRLVRGVIMRSDFPIYRRDPDGYEFYLIYRADTIRQMAEKYLAENRQNRIDTDHDGNEVRGVNMVQFYIKDTAAGISPAGFEDIADGSLFAEFHVTSDTIWEEIKAGVFSGFSLEGFFDYRPDHNQRDIDTIVDELAGRFAAMQNQEIDMTKIEKMLDHLRELLEAAPVQQQKFGEITTDRGILAWPGENDLVAGDRIFIVEQDGEYEPAPNGEYMTDDGKTIVVANGIVAEIRDPEAEVAPQEAEAQQEQMEAAEEAPAPVVEEAAPVAEEAAPVVEDTPAPAVEMEDWQAKYNDAVAANTTLEAELEAARAEIASLKSQPAAKPAHEEVREASRIGKTGNKAIDRLNELMGR